MTKQEELAGLRTLKEHYQAIELLEHKIRDTRASVGDQMDLEIARRAPRAPERPAIVEQGEHDNIKEQSFLQYCPPMYFSIILGVFHAIAVVAMCVILNQFFSSISEDMEAPYFLVYLLYAVLAVFHIVAICFVIWFDRSHKFSGIVGFAVCCALSLGFSLGPVSEHFEVIPDKFLFVLIGLPLITLAAAIVFKIVEFCLYVTQKVKFRRASKRYSDDCAAWRKKVKAVEDQVREEHRPKRAEAERICDELRDKIEAHKSAINSTAILHRAFHENLDYIMRLMETGVADSIKEALQIKRAEDQQSQANAAAFGAMLDMQNFQRKQEEDRRWQEQREQWERDRVQADRDRERAEQAKRAADELERIRKNLEDNS